MLPLFTNKNGKLDKMKNVILKVNSPFVIEGDIVKKGQLVEMTEKEARPLLDRNKVDLATDDDLKAAGVYRGIRGAAETDTPPADETKAPAPATPPAPPAAPAAPATAEQKAAD